MTCVYKNFEIKTYRSSNKPRTNHLNNFTDGIKSDNHDNLTDCKFRDTTYFIKVLKTSSKQNLCLYFIITCVLFKKKL